MDNWEKFYETAISSKEAFYSMLNLENISDEDYGHAQKVWKVFGIKNCGLYHASMFCVINYCLHMCLKTLEISALKYMNLILHILCPHRD